MILVGAYIPSVACNNEGRDFSHVVAFAFNLCIPPGGIIDIVNPMTLVIPGWSDLLHHTKDLIPAFEAGEVTSSGNPRI